jgi:hypothetical protein
MKQLTVERAKRERELDLLRTSEPKIMAELADLRERMQRMRSEMEVFQDLERMRREHEGTMGKLHDLKQSYIKRRDTMRQQVLNHVRCCQELVVKDAQFDCFLCL